MNSLKDHDFVSLQAQTDLWLHTYAEHKMSGDEYVEHMANMRPANRLQISPNADAQLWVEKYPDSYAAH